MLERQKTRCCPLSAINHDSIWDVVCSVEQMPDDGVHVAVRLLSWLVMTFFLGSPAALAESAKASAAGVEANAEEVVSGGPPQQEDKTDAADTLDSCLAAHVEGQQLRQSNQLLASRSVLSECATQACPAAVRGDCLRFVDELKLQIPSLVFRVRADGESRMDVKVFIDNELVLDGLSSKALELDPGEHRFRFELAGFDPIEKPLIVAEGEKFRVVSVEFGSPAEVPTAVVAAPRPAAERSVTEGERPIPTITYVLGGVGAAGLASFVGWGLATTALKNDLEDSCAPNCPDERVDQLRQRALIADASLAVGVGALVTGAVFYLLRPSKEPAASAVDVSVLPGRGVMTHVRVVAF